LDFCEKVLQTRRFQPCVVVQEEEVLAAGAFGRAVVAFAIAQVPAMLDEGTARPTFENLRGEPVRAVAGEVPLR